MSDFDPFAQPDQRVTMTLPQAMQAALGFHQAGQLPQAEAVYRQILGYDPRYADALHGLGVLANQTGHSEAAVDLIRRAVEQRPDVAEFHNNLGLALRGAGRFEEAVAGHRRALELRPGDAEALNNLGLALRDAGRREEAEAAFRQAIQAGPNLPHVYNNLGNLLRDAERYDEAIGAFRTAIRLRPDYAKAYSNLGSALQFSGRMDEALAAFARSVEIDPNYAHGHWNRSLVMLAVGDWVRGWLEYEWRWQCPAYAPMYRRLHQPAWEGTNPAGLTVLLTPEQGFGDTIQFSRFIRPLAKRGATVWLACEPELAGLMQSVEGVSRVFPDPGAAHMDQIPPGFDLQLPLLSLPLRLGTTLETLPNQVPYLHPDPARVAAWKERLERDDAEAAGGAGGAPPLRVGLVWAGKPLPDPRRTCGLAALAPLAAVPVVRFYSLQRGDAAKEALNPPAGMTLADVGGDLHDFQDTAALIVNLDLVITIDSAVAHLAGALGAPVWTMLRFTADWRWMVGREDSPWYPTMRLFRQPTPGDWASVANRVAEELKRISTQSSARLAGGLARRAFVLPASRPTPATKVPRLLLPDGVPPPRLGPQQLARVNQLTATAAQHLDAGRLDEAEKLCREALDLQPGWPNALDVLGRVAFRTGRSGLALELLSRAVRARPDDADLHNNYGMALQSLGWSGEAAAQFQQAVRHNPKATAMYNNLGVALTSEGRLDEAVAAFQGALRLRPNDAEASMNLGVTLTKLGRYDEALEHFRRALRVNPNYGNAHCNVGLMLLARGDLAEGLREFEWRWHSPAASPYRRNFPQPLWRGQDIRGRTILLHAEQGLGDTLQFARYVPLVAGRVGFGGRVIVECKPGQMQLLASIAGVSQIVPFGSALPPFDIHCPLMGLPLAFGTTLQTIPNQVPYLAADPAKVQAWRARLSRNQEPANRNQEPVLSAEKEQGAPGASTQHSALSTQHYLRVGLVWAGNPLHRNDRNRSMPLAALAPLGPLSAEYGVTFFSLQLGSPSEQAKSPPAGMKLIDLSADLRDWSDTAAAVCNLDLLISVDTAAVHLAGALARPVWTLLPFDPDWRWLLGRSDSPWYPTMRLFRQPRIGDWDSVALQVAAALRDGAAAAGRDAAMR